MPWRGHQRYLLGFLAATAIMLLVGFSIMVATQRFRDAALRVERSQQRIGLIAQVRSQLYDGIATQRSYLITGDPTLLREYQAVRPAIRQDLAKLAAIADGDAALARDGEQLARLIEARLDSSDEGVRLLQSRGFAAAQAQVRTNQGRRILKQVEALAMRVVSRERDALRQHGAAAHRSANLLLGLGMLGIPVSLALVWWIFALLSREVRQREDAEARLGSANAQLVASVAELERAGADLAELGRYASHLQGCRSIAEAMEATRQALITLLPWCAGSLYLMRASADYAEAAMQWGDPAAPHRTLMAPDDCWGLRRGKPYAVDDLRRGTSCGHFEPPHEVQPVATECFPLGAQNAVLGVLSLSQRRAGPIPRIERAAAVAEQLSLALGNLRLRETLRQQSIRDPLTGLYNRRYLEESLPRELARCERTGHPLAVVMLDLDHFKAFNDSHGHEAGDRLLATFAQLLQSLSRREDIACRYGGEEFTLILPETPSEVAVRRANEIREALAQVEVQYQDQRLPPPTVSVGVAMFPDHGRDGPQLREAADAALYRAKREGRDRVELA